MMAGTYNALVQGKKIPSKEAVQDLDIQIANKHTERVTPVGTTMLERPVTAQMDSYSPFQGMVTYIPEDDKVKIIIGYLRNRREGYRDTIHFGKDIHTFWEPDTLELPLKKDNGKYLSSFYESSVGATDASYYGYTSSSSEKDELLRGNDVDGDAYYVYYKIYKDKQKYKDDDTVEDKKKIANKLRAELKYSKKYPVLDKYNKDNKKNAVYWVLGRCIGTTEKDDKNKKSTTWQWVQYWTGGQIYVGTTSRVTNLAPFEAVVEVLSESVAAHGTTAAKPGTYNVLIEGGPTVNDAEVRKFIPRHYISGVKDRTFIYVNMLPKKLGSYTFKLSSAYQLHIVSDSHKSVQGKDTPWYATLTERYPIQYPIQGSYAVCSECDVTEHPKLQNCMRINYTANKMPAPAADVKLIGMVDKNSPNKFVQLHTGEIQYRILGVKRVQTNTITGFEGMVWIARAHNKEKTKVEYSKLLHINEGYLMVDRETVHVSSYRNYSILDHESSQCSYFILSNIAEGDTYYINVQNNIYDVTMGEDQDIYIDTSIKHEVELPDNTKGNRIVPIGKILNRFNTPNTGMWAQYQIGNFIGNIQW